VTSNVSHTVTIPNHLLQGNFKNLYNDSGRFLINTTFGILGLFDPAEKLGFKKIDQEDYGQTLGFWGVGNGCYLMLPLFGPSTTRDAVGKVANSLFDPFYLTTVGDQTVLDNNFGDSTYYVERGFDNVDFRAKNLKNFESLEKNSVDLYSTVRSLYLQKRENLISNSSGSEDDWKNFK
jgi:phospholipid-binding lipoprotein MlaA